jgi:hypothetical protein
MNTEREHVICVSLSAAEWRALVARHPQPQHWLREQILQQLSSSPDAATRGHRSDAASTGSSTGRA